MTTIRCRDVSGGGDLDLEVARVVIAGFTGRERAAVQEHIDELAHLGVPVPERTPAFYTVDPALLTTADCIDVEGSFTSGEIEPVVVVHDGRWWLTAGSDHTDRDLERTGIEVSKRACPKPIADEFVPLDEVTAWDSVELSSWVDGGEGVYQSGSLGQILPLDTILAELAKDDIALRDGDVLFLGTVPVSDGQLRPSDTFRGELLDPVAGRRISLQYRTHVRR